MTEEEFKDTVRDFAEQSGLSVWELSDALSDLYDEYEEKAWPFSRKSGDSDD